MSTQDDDLAQLEKFHHEYKQKDAEINLDNDNEVQSLAQEERHKDKKPVTQAQKGGQTQQEESPSSTTTSGPGLEAYIGAEMYARRLYPTGCPGFQKMAIKLFKLTKGRLKLVDSFYFNNREGFGYMLKNLPKG